MKRRGSGFDDDDDFIAFGPRSMIVHEEDDGDCHVQIGLLGPDGNPIHAIEFSEKQGFIGFLCPSWAEDRFVVEPEEDEEE